MSELLEMFFGFFSDLINFLDNFKIIADISLFKILIIVFVYKIIFKFIRS